MKSVKSCSLFAKISVISVISIIVVIYLCVNVDEPPTKEKSPVYLNASLERGVIVSLIRSTDRSISLTINMIHSILRFYPRINNSYYPFLIFHDENFTTDMRLQILSCVHNVNNQIQISFALAQLHTNVTPNVQSQVDKPISYRMMCRFWTYDVFYHPAIVQGQYEYLMRMDDDSYFSNVIDEDLFHYMHNQNLDYIFRSKYVESMGSLQIILQRLYGRPALGFSCIYNNFFIVRLKWYRESKVIKRFLKELLHDDYMLREYIGDGCIHSALLHFDKQAKAKHLNNIDYGHNYHLMNSPTLHWIFRVANGFYQQTSNSCQKLTVIRGNRGKLIQLNMKQESSSTTNKST